MRDRLESANGSAGGGSLVARVEALELARDELESHRGSIAADLSHIRSELAQDRADRAELNTRLLEAVDARDGLPTSRRGKATWAALVLSLSTMIADRVIEFVDHRASASSVETRDR
jgi:hypothetical protein